MSGSTDGGRVCNGVNIKEHHPRGDECVEQSRGWDLCFFLGSSLHYPFGRNGDDR